MVTMKKFKRFFGSISNLVYWLPKVWKDRQWDDYYFHQMLIWKLQRMEDFFNSENARTEDATNCAKEINEVKTLFLRIIADNYFEEIGKDYIDKYWKNGAADWLNDLNKEDSEKRAEFSAINAQAYKSREDDLDKAYSKLRNNIQNWWD